MPAHVRTAVAIGKPERRRYRAGDERVRGEAMVTMSAVWDRTTEFLSDNAGVVLAIVAPAVLLPSVVQDVVQPLSVTAAPLPKLGLALVSLACSGISLWGQLALIALALDPVLDRGGAFARAAPRFLPMVGVGLILLVLMFALLLPIFVLMAVGGVDFAQLPAGVAPNLNPGTALLIALYVLIVIPIMAWVFARLAVVSPVVVAERRGAGALRRSFALTKGLAIRIIGVLALFLIVALVAVLAAKTVFGSVLRIVFGDHGPLDAANIVTAVVVAVITTAATAIVTAFLAKLYVALVARTDTAAA